MHPFLHMSPQIKVGEKVRELTDVMASHEYGSFLIEAKDLSIFQSGFLREQERRTKGAQKQTQKAITQLVGASKAAKRGDPITDRDGRPLSESRATFSLHCFANRTNARW